LRVGFSHQVEAIRAGLEVEPEHTKHAAGLVVAHIIDGGIGDIVFLNICPYVLVGPKGHWHGSRPLQIEGVAAVLLIG